MPLKKWILPFSLVLISLVVITVSAGRNSDQGFTYAVESSLKIVGSISRMDIQINLVAPTTKSSSLKPF